MAFVDFNQKDNRSWFTLIVNCSCLGAKQQIGSCFLADMLNS